MMNKKAGEKYLFFWMFLNWILIGSAVVLVVIMFYLVDLNTREVETRILAVKTLDCLVDNGYLVEDVFLDDFDFFSFCNIEKNVFDTRYYVRFKIFKNNEGVENFEWGVKNVRILCGLRTKSELRDDPGCEGVELGVLRENDDNKWRLDILVG
ncbi:hypothetical protein GOV14_00795, partial [Candidatus Pacearchaeota archaeon]|nr:hypothetical protein [Candidatus Pacearchaeota archaeon]